MSTLFNPKDPKWIKATQEIMEARGIPSFPRNQPSFGEYREESMTIEARLLKDRIVFIGTQIDNNLANRTVALLLYLQSEDATKDINLYINSPGGVIYSGLAVYDTMQWLKPDVSTVCVGMAMSMGAILLTAGTKGKRYCLPNSTVLIHQPLIQGEMEGQASDLEIEAREILRQRHLLYEILAHHTGQSFERITHDADRDNYFSAQQAVEYGLVDEVLSPEEKASKH